MNITKTFVNKPTTVLIIFVVLVGLGLYATMDLPLDLLPDMELPYVAVMCSYPGAGPEEVENRVTRTLESALSSVTGIEYLGSSSSMGSSMVYVQLSMDVNIDEAMNDIRDKIDYIKGYLPEDCTAPMIYKLNPDVIPIMQYAISGNRTPEELRDFAETITPKLEQIDGVASVSVSGGREKAIIVDIPRDRLEAYNLTISQIAQMMAAQNISVSGGTITEEDLNYTISTVGEYSSIEDIKDTVISYKVAGSQQDAMLGGALPKVVSIRLRDIADVYEGYKEQTSVFYLDGVPCVQLSIQKQSGKNSVQTARAVQKKMASIISTAPNDIVITEIVNTTSIIERSISEVASSALTGALFAVLVLFLFLRNFKSTLIISLTIPISLIVTLGIMYFSGMTLNIMTLAGLSLGVGMLVDNSIVILENIYTYREKGAKPKTAAVLGSSEMIMAISASTLTTICVFLPLILYKAKLGIISEVFEGLTFTVVISLVCSLVVAVVLVPVLTSKYIKINITKKEKKSIFDKFFDGLDNGFGKSLAWVLRHKALTLGVIFALLIGSIAYIPKVGFEYMPASASDSIAVDVTLPVGTKLESTEAILQQLEQRVKSDVKGYVHITTLVGSSEMMGLGGSSSYKGTLTITLPPIAQRIDSENEIKAKLRGYFSEIPGASFGLSSSSMMSMTGGAAVTVAVKSEDLDKARETADAIKLLLEEKASDVVTEPTLSMQDGLPQVNIVIDRERMYNLGLNVYTIGQEIKANIAGTTASRYRDNGEEVDIVLKLSDNDKTQLADLEHIFVTNSQGVRIPLSSFAKYEEGVAPITISRENQSRYITVSCGSVPGVSIDKVQNKVETLISQNIQIDEDVVIEYSGDFESLVETLKLFVGIIIMAAVLVFAVMASQFESFLDPFIVLFTLPLTIIGIVIIYAVMGVKMNVMTAVGLLILVGIIVNNGIVLVDYTNLLRKRGYTLMDACVEAGKSRLRPILMTTLTTVLALVPMGFFPGEGSEMTQPIGLTVFGGLTFGTLMTLFLIPTLYYCFNRVREKKAEKKARKLEKKQQKIASKNAIKNQEGAE